MNSYSKQDLARLGEDLALKFLITSGYVIVCRNYLCQFGEIDLIVEKDQHLVFVEVKTRSYHSLQSALDNITYRKQVKISQTAQVYCNQNPAYSKHQTRFDVIVVFYDSRDNTFKVQHLIDAFLPILPD